jgi:hypothetical protein
MASQISADWNASAAQSSQSEGRRARGAGWVIAALYVFCALVVVSWFGPWANNDRSETAAPPPQHQHSTHATQG